MKAQSLENKLLKDTIEMQKMKIQELRDSLSQTYSVHPETIYIPEGEDLKRESKQDTVRNSQEDNEVEPSNGS